MPGPEVMASPVMVGRDEPLALAARRLDEASARHGRLLLVAGEAGIGKTRLLGSITRQAHRSGFDVARAAAFASDANTSGGVLLDLAGDLARAASPAVRSSVTHSRYGCANRSPPTAIRTVNDAFSCRISPTSSSTSNPIARF